MVKRTKNTFTSRLAEAHEQHKGDTTRVGSGGDLPAGIEHGIAELNDIKIGVYQKGDYVGEPYFMAAGIVREPKSTSIINPETKKTRVVLIEGLRTQIGPEPLCDTTAQNGNETSLADHWDRVLNHLRLLGVDTSTIEPGDIIEEEKGEYTSGVILQALKTSDPPVTFRFRTWSGKPSTQYPNPRINHEWKGECSYTPSEGDDVVDNTEETKWESDPKIEAEANTESAPEVSTKSSDKQDKQDKHPLGLAEVADAGKPKVESDKAAKELAILAEEKGISNYEDMPTWKDVAEAIMGNGTPKESTEEFVDFKEEEEDPEEWIPLEGEEGIFKHPKTGEIQCTFVKVYPKLEKVDLKRSDTGRITKNVPFKLLNAG